MEWVYFRQMLRPEARGCSQVAEHCSYSTWLLSSQGFQGSPSELRVRKFSATDNNVNTRYVWDNICVVSLGFPTLRPHRSTTTTLEALPKMVVVDEQNAMIANLVSRHCLLLLASFCAHLIGSN